MQVSFFSIGEEAGQVKYVKAGQKPFGQFCCLTSSSLNNCSKFMHGHCKYTGHTAVLWTHGESKKCLELLYYVQCWSSSRSITNGRKSHNFTKRSLEGKTHFWARGQNTCRTVARTRIVTSELLLKWLKKPARTSCLLFKSFQK